MCAMDAIRAPRRLWAAAAKILLLCGLALLLGCQPVIKSFTPEHGPVGTQVTIKGLRLGESASDSTVKFKGVTVPAGDMVYLSSTHLKAKVPTGALTGQISVTTSKGTGFSEKNFTVDVPGTPEWTFMVYLDADNNLESAGIDDFLEMASVTDSNKVNIIVQMDRIPSYTSSYGNWTGTRRFSIGHNDTPSMAPVQDLGEQNMGDPNVLQDFVEWAITNYPAKRYMLSIWNHGDGWRRSRELLHERAMRARDASRPDQGVAKAVATDDTDNDVLYMREVQTALEAARQRLGTVVKLDVVGFDACLMGMVEVTYACRDVANHVVGSEDLEPGDGWPYDTILADLVATPTMTPQQLADLVVDKYGSYYGSGTTQSAVDVSELSNLASKINAFTTAANGEWPALKAARLASKQYHPSWSSSCWGVDIWDFADEVHSRVASTTIKTAAAQLKTAVEDFVTNVHPSAAGSDSHGVAVYFPPTQTEFNGDPDHGGYEQSNTFMPVDFVRFENWDNWLLDHYYTNIP